MIEATKPSLTAEQAAAIGRMLDLVRNFLVAEMAAGKEPLVSVDFGNPIRSPLSDCFDAKYATYLTNPRHELTIISDRCAMPDQQPK